MQFKEVIDSPCGLRYMADNLELQSPAGRRALMHSRMLCNLRDIEKVYDKLREFIEKIVSQEKAKATMRMLRIKLSGLKDCTSAIRHLSSGQRLDEIGLFEIKKLGITCREIKTLLEQAEISSITIPEMTYVISLLDPDNTGTETFYIYDTYDSRLAQLRKKIRSNDDSNGVHLTELKEIESEICAELSGKLEPHAATLMQAFDASAETDLLLAKALQTVRMQLTLPVATGSGMTSYKGFFHPEVRSEVEAAKRDYQKIDISFGDRPMTIIGANMGGKTVVLRSVALAQYLFQFGFGIPAEEAVISPVEEIHLRIGDAEVSVGGLSSFGAEISAIGAILERLRRGKRHIVLLDEPARTTNPIEGTALVTALVNIFCRLAPQSIVTTHYNLHEAECVRMKVKGLIDMQMDYRLAEVADGEVPHEAIAVARMMGTDEEWLTQAELILNRDK